MKSKIFFSGLLRCTAVTVLCMASCVGAVEVDAPTDTVELVEFQERLSQAVQSTRDVALQTGQAVEAGMASWYGRAFQGRRTASGERFDMNELTAAHKTLPLGTVVQVRNPINGKTVDVKINDRGPFVKDRIIDLSYKAALMLGIVKSGKQPVEVQRR
jgi:rare lipoprotein A